MAVTALHDCSLFTVTPAKAGAHHLNVEAQAHNLARPATRVFQ
ncbi:hypothetical protein [Sandarakinorhabdus glacialis]|nr:hypothetical protein [Polymorphobacter glacialis]